MRKLHSRWLLAALIQASLSFSAVYAQLTPVDVPTLSPIVVTATRVPQPLADLVADVTIIDRATIQRSGETGVADVLARVPGIQISRPGNVGSPTSVFLRGAESRYTAVFIDGVRVDSQSTGGASWQTIPLAQIDRIEVLRGPAAAVYGSDAIGGVIQLFTRKGDGALTPSIGVGIGTYNTKKWMRHSVAQAELLITRLGSPGKPVLVLTPSLAPLTIQTKTAITANQRTLSLACRSARRSVSNFRL